MGYVFSAIMTALVACCGWLIWTLATQETISISASEWECTEHIAVSGLQVIPTGKTVTVVPTAHTTCSNYRRIAR